MLLPVPAAFPRCCFRLWRSLRVMARLSLQRCCHMVFTDTSNDINDAAFWIIKTKTTVRKKTRQIWVIWKLRLAYSPETPNLGQNRWCFVPCDLEIWWMTCFVQHFIAIGESKLELQSGNAQFGSNLKIFRAVWPWNLTDDLEKQ